MKKIIILQHGGGELANQLWNHISIYAYSREKNIPCENYSFFEYSFFFNLPIRNTLINFFFFTPFRGHIERRNGLRTRFFRKLYKTYSFLVRKTRGQSIVSSKNKINTPFYLPPTEKNDLASRESTLSNIVYFDGWLFRNPEGLVKYRESIVHEFTPVAPVQDKIKNILTPLREKYANVIGVHFRQGDYKDFKDGRYLLSEKRLNEVFQEYLREYGKKPEETIFLIASDGSVSLESFAGLNVSLLHGNAVEDLFTLSGTDTVIGSNSSFGNLAAYFGDIPHIVMSKEPIDWEYYRGKTHYFPTKYCTMVQY